MNIFTLLGKCRELGVVLTPMRGQLRIQAPEPLPDELVLGLKEAKAKILAELQRQIETDNGCWLLEEWRRISIPEWQRILQESIEVNDRKREEYARWMLREVLEDPEYSEVNK